MRRPEPRGWETKTKKVVVGAVLAILLLAVVGIIAIYDVRIERTHEGGDSTPVDLVESGDVAHACFRPFGSWWFCWNQETIHNHTPDGFA